MGNTWDNISKGDEKKILKSWGIMAIIGGVMLLIGGFIALMSWRDISIGRNSMTAFIVGLIIMGIGFIFAMMPSAQKKALDSEELRKAQLQALRRGKSNVHIKGNMRKLK